MTEVSIKDFAFDPTESLVNVGDTVCWTNQDDASHTVTNDTNVQYGFSSNALQKGDSYQHTFETVGEFPYYCSFHKHMKGIVRVVDSGMVGHYDD